MIGVAWMGTALEADARYDGTFAYSRGVSKRRTMSMIIGCNHAVIFPN